MNCIIIADKPSKGTKSKGWSGLTPLNSRQTLIQNQIKTLRKNFPKSKIIYIYGFDSKKVEDYFAETVLDNFVYIKNNKFDSTGESYSVDLAKEFLNKECLIMYGNIILKSNSFKNFDKKKSHIYVGGKSSSALGCTLNEKGVVTHICYGLDKPISNVYYIGKKDIEKFKNMVTRNDYRNYFVFEIINKMIETETQFLASPVDRENIFQTISDKK